jgi:hypothetical protein
MKILLSDFTPFPGFRYKTQTPDASGEEFRNNVLIPALDKHNEIVVDLDTGIQNRDGILPSFLNEAFGELAHIKKWNLDEFKKHVKIKTLDQEYSSDIYHYVEVCNH